MADLLTNMPKGSSHIVAISTSPNSLAQKWLVRVCSKLLFFLFPSSNPPTVQDFPSFGMLVAQLMMPPTPLHCSCSFSSFTPTYAILTAGTTAAAVSSVGDTPACCPTSHWTVPASTSQLSWDMPNVPPFPCSWPVHSVNKLPLYCSYSFGLL